MLMYRRTCVGVCVTCRSKSSDAVYLQDVNLYLPRPEFDFFAERAAASSSFVVQLMGEFLSIIAATAATGLEPCSHRSSHWIAE